MTRTPKITQSRFRLAEHVTLNYVAQPDFGVTLEHVLDDAYWGHVASMLKEGYTIECLPEALTWYAKLIVVDAGPVHAKVKVLHFVDLVTERPKVTQAPIVGRVELGKFRVERSEGGFRVLRVADQEVMKKGFKTVKAAQEWASENLQVDIS